MSLEKLNNFINFNNDEFGEITVINQDGEPWFIGKEIAEKLGYKDTAKAIKFHIDENNKGEGKIPTPGGLQKMILINESGLYSLILGSKLKSARAFQQWVTEEVLPSIRKYGFYIPDSARDQALKYLKNLRVDSNNVFKALADMFKVTSDYYEDSNELKKFYATMRNKLYQCTIGMTAAEIKYNRADHTKENMNLVTHKGKKWATKADVQAAIGYITEEEMDLLIRVTNITIDFMEYFIEKEYEKFKSRMQLEAKQNKQKELKA